MTRPKTENPALLNTPPLHTTHKHIQTQLYRHIHTRIRTPGESPALCEENTVAMVEKRVFVYPYIHIHTYKHTEIQKYVHKYIYIHVYIYMFIYLHTCTSCAPIYVYMYALTQFTPEKSQLYGQAELGDDVRHG